LIAIGRPASQPCYAVAAVPFPVSDGPTTAPAAAAAAGTSSSTLSCAGTASLEACAFHRLVVSALRSGNRAAGCRHAVAHGVVAGRGIGRASWQRGAAWRDPARREVCGGAPQRRAVRQAQAAKGRPLPALCWIQDTAVHDLPRNRRVQDERVHSLAHSVHILPVLFVGEACSVHHVHRKRAPPPAGRPWASDSARRARRYRPRGRGHCARVGCDTGPGRICRSPSWRAVGIRSTDGDGRGRVDPSRRSHFAVPVWTACRRPV
jgi:hypothetical protein